ncbi:MAG: glycosyltransferase [Clostridia bacterium]|nr:glycosyltransferase [Clostridia bacterium]
MLDIIMPHYDEPWEEGKKFFSMLDLQRDADFSQVRVILVQDGPENTLDDFYFSSRPYEVRQILIPHGGVSAARNAGLKVSDAEWVMFCDFDDMFSNVYTLRDILNVLSPAYDVLWADFFSEDKMADGSMRLHTRGRNLVFIHGKVYRREFLLEHDLWFDTALKFNEDSCFNAIANTIVDYRRTGQIKTLCPPYIWCYREGSATTSPENQGQALLGLYERNKRVCEAFRKRMPYDRYCAMVARTIWDTYYSCNVDKYVPLLDRVIALEEECKPHIISQPESQSVSAGTVISFTVEARNAGVYQWQYRTSANGAWTNPSTGANKSIYSLTAQTRHNGYQYHCIVSNTLGEVTTSIVTLTVT